MGPINSDWIQKNGNHWAGGRIDVYGSEEYPDEIGLPIMHVEDYGKFSEWLDSFTSIAMWTLEELVLLFEKQTKIHIRWFHTPYWEEEDANSN